MFSKRVISYEIEERNRIIMNRLDSIMRKDRLFLRDITLDETAKLLSTNRNYLSTAINSRGMNYKEYICSLRARYAEDIIINDRKERFTIEEIANKSGFVTERTLNKYLKRSIGYTVHEFRKKLRSSPSIGKGLR